MKLARFVSAFLLILVFSATASGVVRADNFGETGLVNPLGNQNSVEGLLHSIVDWLIKIGTPIAVGMILVGAFQMLFSGGNEESFKRGRRTILYTAIGYVIILIGWGLTSIIQDFLSQ